MPSFSSSYAGAHCPSRTPRARTHLYHHRERYSSTSSASTCSSGSRSPSPTFSRSQSSRKRHRRRHAYIPRVPLWEHVFLRRLAIRDRIQSQWFQSLISSHSALVEDNRRLLAAAALQSLATGASPLIFSAGGPDVPQGERKTNFSGVDHETDEKRKDGSLYPFGFSGKSSFSHKEVGGSRADSSGDGPLPSHPPPPPPHLGPLPFWGGGVRGVGSRGGGTGGRDAGTLSAKLEEQLAEATKRASTAEEHVTVLKGQLRQAQKKLEEKTLESDVLRRLVGEREDELGDKEKDLAESHKACEFLQKERSQLQVALQAAQQDVMEKALENERYLRELLRYKEAEATRLNEMQQLYVSIMEKQQTRRAEKTPVAAAEDPAHRAFLLLAGLRPTSADAPGDEGANETETEQSDARRASPSGRAEDQGDDGEERSKGGRDSGAAEEVTASSKHSRRSSVSSLAQVLALSPYPWGKSKISSANAGNEASASSSKTFKGDSSPGTTCGTSYDGSSPFPLTTSVSSYGDGSGGGGGVGEDKIKRQDDGHFVSPSVSSTRARRGVSSTSGVDEDEEYVEVSPLRPFPGATPGGLGGKDACLSPPSRVQKTLLAHRGSVYACCAVPSTWGIDDPGRHDGAFSRGSHELLLTCGQDGFLALLDATSPSLVYSFLVSPSKAPLLHVDVAFEERVALVAAADVTLYTVNANTQKVTSTLKGHSGRITSCGFLRSSQPGVAGNKRHGDTRSKSKGGDITESLLTTPGGVTSSNLWSCSLDRTVKLWDARRSACVKSTSLGSAITYGAASPDGEWLATAHQSGVVSLISLRAERGEHVGTLNLHEDAASGVAFSPCGRLLATQGKDKQVKLVDVRMWKEIHTLLHIEMRYNLVQAAPVFSCADGTFVAAAAGPHVCCWTLKPQETSEREVFPSSSTVYGGTGNETRFGGSSGGGGPRGWGGYRGGARDFFRSPEGQTSQQPDVVLRTQPTEVTCLNWQLQRGLVTGGKDGSVYFWEH